ncbi:MAG: motility associated factor glycosyltransferase family protein [Nitrospinota bacterium]
MDFFDKNRQSITKTAPRLLEILDSLPPPPKAIKSESGDITVQVGGVLIASSVDPAAEGRKFAKAQSGATSGILVYGLGLGYHLESLLELYANCAVTAVEANMELLSAAMHHRNLSAVFSNNRFSLVTGRDEKELAAGFSKTVGGAGDDLKIAIHPPSYRCLPSGFETVKNSFETLLSERRFKSRFGEQEEKNIRANLRAVSRCPGVISLYGNLRGRPALLVGAGPSLDRNVPLLDWLQDKVFILAVDTASAVLADNGIACHATISVDPQPSSAEHYMEKPSAAPLVFFPTTHPSVVELHKGRRLLAIKDSHSIFGRAGELLKDKGMTNAGGSVSCIGLDLLVKGGADPIGVVGQDFAFTRGNPYNRRTLAGYARGETFHERSVFTQNIMGGDEKLKTLSLHGRDEITNANLLSYLRTFEEIIARSGGRSFFNIDSTGAAIRGCRNLACAGEVVRFFGSSPGAPEPLSIAEEMESPNLEARLSERLFSPLTAEGN